MTDPMELVGRADEKNAPGHINLIDSDTTEELLDLIAEMAACIRKLVEWRPIETAPRDGAWIQAWRTPASPNDGWWEPLVHVRWDDEDEAWVWPDDTYEVFTESGCERADFKIADCEFYSDTSFTHWRPLPLPPAPGAEA